MQTRSDLSSHSLEFGVSRPTSWFNSIKFSSSLRLHIDCTQSTFNIETKMRFLTSMTLIVMILLYAVLAAPVEVTDLSSLNFDPEDFDTLLNTCGLEVQACPASDICGVVTFSSGTYVSFGEGICMQIKGKIQSIYVGHCYCSTWR